ncbi:hypothetical protein FZEAL_4198 [Fusarium zealandicum]|uniref:YDG domain-containing protein n=1 Tax=Fusarium zealandicum TaxID=1053134 RepID=A0A8H4UMW7_9HYPO|nr:hypothetical protein FZEAL_4198 [Fusarium zealandicum]
MQTSLQNVDPLSALGSAASSQDDRQYRAIGLDEDSLLEVCDTVRASLHEGRSLGPRWEEAMGFLAAILRDETDGMPVIEFAAIENARLDKLLLDIVDPENRPSPTPTRFDVDVRLAERLQRRWRARFREDYFTIDQERYLSLSKTGRLKDVEFNLESGSGQERWKAKGCETLSELEGNLEFEPGHWWLNLACAHRDSIIGSARETPTKGKYGVAALPLLTGREDIPSNDGTIRYVREGRITDMHVSLISQVGSTIRILRGHRLHSPFAPKDGIRYDGLYIIRQYGQRLNLNTELHRMILTLQRVDAQQSIEGIIGIPRPSELDDWVLFKKYEGEMIKQKKGDQGFMD